MTMAFAKPEEKTLPRVYQRLDNVDWKAYEAALQEAGDSAIRITYHEGRMEIMSPSPRHEVRKKILGAFVDLIALERNIPMRRLGSTTSKREDLLAGLEPDDCFYVQNADRLGTRDTLDLAVDPPPDLAIEVDGAHRSIAREPIYAALGVTELWRHDGLNLSFRKLESLTKSYTPITTSLAFSFLSSSDLTPFLAMLAFEQETMVLRKFRDWVCKGI
jgi:Uma2 family endonuclease